MTFRVCRTSCMCGGYPEPVYEREDGYFIDIETIDELMKFKEAVGKSLIISDCSWRKDKEPEIEIYDAWRE